MYKYLVGAVVLFAVPFISFADTTVSSGAGVGASVSPNGTTIVPTGVTQTFTFGAQNGYRISNVTLDGVSQGTPSSLGIVGLVVDPDTHTLSVSAVAISNVLPFCSGPLAPGWQVGIAGGGCGGAEVIVAAGSAGCPFWFVNGCVLPR